MNQLSLYIISINVLSYLTMCFDKYQSKKKGYRVPESRLFLMAFMFGSLGIYLGMKAPVYHKASKPKFKIGIPILIIVNAISFYFIYQYQ